MNTKLDFVAIAKFVLGFLLVIAQSHTTIAQSSRSLSAPQPAYTSGQTSQPGLSTSIQSTTPALSPVGRREVAATPLLVFVQSDSAKLPTSPPAESNIRQVYDGLPIQNRDAVDAQPQTRRAEQAARSQSRRAIDSQTTRTETTIRRSNPNRPQANALKKLALQSPDADSPAKGERDEGEADEMEDEGRDDEDDQDEDGDGDDDGDDDDEDGDEDDEDGDEDDEEEEDDDEDEDDEDELLEHLEIIDRLLESATVKRLMSLMEENIELRANLRTQQVEHKMQLQVMELKVNQRLEQAELKLQQHSQKNGDPIIEKLTDALRRAEAGQAAAERRAESMEMRLKELQVRMEQMSRSTAGQKQNAKRDREQADAPKKKPSSKE